MHYWTSTVIVSGNVIKRLITGSWLDSFHQGTWGTCCSIVVSGNLPISFCVLAKAFGTIWWVTQPLRTRVIKCLAFDTIGNNKCAVSRHFIGHIVHAGIKVKMNSQWYKHLIWSFGWHIPTVIIQIVFVYLIALKVSYAYSHCHHFLTRSPKQRYWWKYEFSHH